MTKAIFERAVQLNNDIKNMDKQIKEVIEDRHWISVVTPMRKDLTYSSRFQEELLEWLIAKREEYQKEFEQLN